VRSGKRGEPVTALGFRYSEPFEYSGPQTLALALGEDSEDTARQMAEAYEARRRSDREEGLEVPDAPFVPHKAAVEMEGEIPKALAAAREKDPALAALVKLPAASRRVTLLLAPGPARSLVPHIFDDDPARHPLGMVRIHNLSPHRVLLRTAAGKTMELEPGKSLLAPAPGETFAYELAYRTDGDWIVQENNLTSIRPNEQMHRVVLRSEASFFSSSDGSRGGFMQTAFLRRTPQRL
jgi:hypothetical protein